MGVHDLWKVLEPTARPVLLDSLRGKTLAIDASIWIYQFLKAMRDASGQALRAGHVIGFFRRICKLLFYEIKPVFVFDGAAPLIKKLTTERRKHRAVRRAHNAKATANKLLTLQLQRLHGNEPNQPHKKRKLVKGTITASNEAPKFVPQDQFDLHPLAEIKPVRLNDQRLLTEQELDDYAKEFSESARSTGFVDTDSVDFDSPEFKALPIQSQYQLLNTARLKSRLRMGYTPSQLGQMFPNPDNFSKFQIERVSQRNFFTQRLMNLVGFEDDLATRRVSSEKGKEYMIQRKDGGWTLSLGTHGSPATPQESVKQELEEGQLEESNDEFEDVDLDPKVEAKSESEVASASEPEVEAEPRLPSWFESSAKEPPGVQTSKQSEEDNIMFGNSAARSALFAELAAARPASPQPQEQPSVAIAPSAPSADLEFGSTASRDSLFGQLGALRASAREPSAEPSVEPSVEPSAEASKTGPGSAKRSDLSEANEAPFPQAFKISLDDRSNEPVDLTGSPEQVVDLADASSRSEAESEADLETVFEPPSAPEAASGGRAPVEPELVESLAETLQQTPKKPLIPKSEPVSNSPQPPSHFPEPETIDIDLDAEISEAEKALAEQDALIEEQQEEDIAHTMIEELEENERFLKTINKNAQSGSITAEIDRLKNLHAQQQRDADNVTQEMVNECMELLQLFGIPYVTAPGEAEAQCAELFDLGLVDGVVTDDGDCFLFGSVKVYRNMFNQSKYVEVYESTTIESELGLTRAKLISMAFLLGSDYVDGIVGVGPVTGVELLADFGTLEAFKTWWENVQRNPSEGVDTSFKRKFLKKFATKLFLPEEFPNSAVVEAYEKPNVDRDPTAFTWGSIDVAEVRNFMHLVAGWSHESTNKLIVPVAEESKRRELLQKGQGNQTTLDNFAKVNNQFRSKRASAATKKLANK